MSMRYTCLPQTEDEIAQIYFDPTIYKDPKYDEEDCKRGLRKLSGYKNDFVKLNYNVCRAAATPLTRNQVEYVQHSDCRLNSAHNPHEKIIGPIRHSFGVQFLEFKPFFCHCQDISLFRLVEV